MGDPDERVVNKIFYVYRIFCAVETVFGEICFELHPALYDIFY